MNRFIVLLLKFFFSPRIQGWTTLRSHFLNFSPPPFFRYGTNPKASFLPPYVFFFKGAKFFCTLGSLVGTVVLYFSLFPFPIFTRPFFSR